MIRGPNFGRNFISTGGAVLTSMDSVIYCWMLSLLGSPSTASGGGIPLNPTTTTTTPDGGSGRGASARRRGRR